MSDPKERGEYGVELSPAAQRDLKAKKCRDHLGEIVEQLQILRGDPFIGKPLKGSLYGARALKLNLSGRGGWRAVYYVVVEDGVCVVFGVDTRENFYQKSIVDRYRGRKGER